MEPVTRPDPEPLTPEEARVLGCLIEKERTVPDSYPLTLNALVGACNQTTNREPIMSLEPFEVEATLMQLRSRGFTRVVHSPSNRVEKYRHVTGELLGLYRPPGAKAVLLTALGLADPSARGQCFALARKLNFSKRFPHLLLARALGTAGPGR